MRPMIAAAALMIVPSLAVAADSIEKVSYACADNEVLHVTYVNTDGGSSFAVVLDQDELIPMTQQVSASGAIYKAISPDYALQLLTKGKTADLVGMTDGKEVFLKKDCTAD